MSRRTFDIDADISRAEAPPGWLYTDQHVYQVCLERIFARTWHLVADVDSVRVPGQVYPFTLLDGAIDEPLVLIRDRDDHLHCLSNVCTHRGQMVCEHPGLATSLRCRYHGRRFGLDGRFQHMPEFEQTVGFPSPADDLPQVPVGLWERFIFAALRPHVALQELLEPVRQRVNWLPTREFTPNASRSRDYLVRANWALYCENYLEGFHIPYVHAGLNEVLDYGSYRTELFRFSSLQVGIARGAEACFDLPPDSPDYGQHVAAYYFWLFPATMLNFYPWGLSVNVVRPLGVDRTRVSFLSYEWRPDRLDEGAGSGLDRVEREDEAIVEAVQRGVRSRLYGRGRYSPTREQGTHHFHRLLAEFLA